MQLTGQSLHDENVYNAKRLIAFTFEDDPSYCKNVFLWQHSKKEYTDEDIIPIRLNSKKHSESNGETIEFQVYDDVKIIVGDILYRSDENEYWLCTEAYSKGGVHRQGKLTLCTWILKWQNNKGDIFEYPCVDRNATQYNSGEQANKQFTIGSSQHLILMPSDENTYILATPKRFYLDKNTIDPTSFIITQNDTTSYNVGEKGLVRLTLTECANDNAADRPDLGICDYIDPDTIVKNNLGNIVSGKSVIEYTSDVIRSGGDTQIFTAKFYDELGNEITDIVPKWNIICDFNNELEVSRSGNSLSMAIDNDDYIDEDIRLELSDSDGNFLSSMIISIESLL